MKIRKIIESDAEKFLALSKALDNETKFMLFEPDERKITVEQQIRRIQNILANDLSVIFVCEIDGNLVGFITALRDDLNRVRHSAYIVIGVKTEYTGKGIGSKLFAEMEKWATKNGVHRLQLTVMCHNVAGVALYQKMGFEIEGIKKHSLMVDGQMSFIWLN